MGEERGKEEKRERRGKKGRERKRREKARRRRERGGRGEDGAWLAITLTHRNLPSRKVLDKTVGEREVGIRTPSNSRNVCKKNGHSSKSMVSAGASCPPAGFHLQQCSSMSAVQPAEQQAGYHVGVQPTGMEPTTSNRDGGTASSRAISNIATNNMATNMFVQMFCASGVPAFRVRFQGTPRAVQMSGRASHSRCVTMLPEPPNPNLINSNWTSFEPPPRHRITPRDLKNLVPIRKKSSQRFVRVSCMFFLCCSSSFLLCPCCSMFLSCFLILHFYLHLSMCCFQHDFVFIGQVSASRGGHFRK